MRSDSDNPKRLRKVTGPNAIALVVILAVSAIVIAFEQPWDGEPTGVRPSANDRHSAAVSPKVNVAAELVAQIETLDRATSLDEFIAAAGDSPTAKAWATTVWTNLKLLGATDVSLRFQSGGQPTGHAGGTVKARTEVRWRPGVESGLAQVATARTTVVLIFDTVGGDAYAVRGARQSHGPIPIWLAGKLSITRIGAGTVISIDSQSRSIDSQSRSGKIADYVETAQQAVHSLLGSAGSSNTDSAVVDVAPVVVVANTETQAAAVLGQSRETIAQLAAVTTTIDGSVDPKAATAIFINPAVFSTMDARAAQIVITHEATHQMTGATLANSERWVVEGFADFVALHNDKAALTVSAGQILKQVKADGPPDSLPTQADFNTSKHGSSKQGSPKHGLGATYEAAWMVFRMLGERFDDSTIIDFYRDVLGGASAADAVRNHFGVTLEQLTGQWQSYLLKSVST